MSIRQGLLAILDQGPCYGYQLRTEFERRTGSTWPINVGQVYSTLDRLERDGLIGRSTTDDQGRALYEITPAGHADVVGWLSSPVERTTIARDELAIKLAVAVTLPGVDITAVIQVQRAATLRALQELTRTKAATSDPDTAEDLAWLLVVDALIFQAEAEVRWLDHSESRLERAHLAPTPLAAPARRGRPARSAR